jgi:hypothetical protein
MQLDERYRQIPMRQGRLSLGFLCTVAAFGLAAVHPAVAKERPSAGVREPVQQNGPAFRISADVQRFAQWATHSGDHQRLPFIVVDKINATASAFDAAGRHIRSTPVLLGMGIGDTFAPGVADMDMHQTQPWQRITPAGRFFAEEDLNLQGERVLWVDYDTAIAIHKLSAKRTKQRRHERIRSPSPTDNRITFGCINVPPAFYDQVVHPNFRAKGGIVYVLPDTMPMKSVFKSYDAPKASMNPAQQGISPVSTALGF